MKSFFSFKLWRYYILLLLIYMRCGLVILLMNNFQLSNFWKFWSTLFFSIFYGNNFNIFVIMKNTFGCCFLYMEFVLLFLVIFSFFFNYYFYYMFLLFIFGLLSINNSNITNISNLILFNIFYKINEKLKNVTYVSHIYEERSILLCNNKNKNGINERILLLFIFK